MIMVVIDPIPARYPTVIELDTKLALSDPINQSHIPIFRYKQSKIRPQKSIELFLI